MKRDQEESRRVKKGQEGTRRVRKVPGRSKMVLKGSRMFNKI